MKRCSICGEFKEDTAFHHEVKNKDGLNSHCKKCERVRNQAYYELHAEERKAYQRRYSQLMKQHGVRRKKKQALQ